MTQTVPSWTAILLGGGLLSAVTGISVFVTKGVVDKKDAHIKYLDKLNVDLKDQVSTENQKTKKVFEQFREYLQKTDTNSLDADDLLRFQEIFGVLEDFGEILGGFENCEQAAEWLRIRRDVWVNASTRKAASRYKRLLPRLKLSGFRKDIKGYLDWAYECLKFHGGRTANVPVANFVKTPSVPYSHPYISAINYIIETEDWGELNDVPRAYIKEVLMRLTDQLPSEFIEGCRNAEPKC